ncbi:MAG: hypothetical protein CL424_14610 [Acidimicrobiaceae bacterium]|nr:hypothetical protein [Acidimicrobiaceae bacterium]
MSIQLTWPLTSDTSGEPGAITVEYTAEDWRQPWANLFTEGILGASSFEVPERALGANMTLDIAAGAGWITGDDASGQGVYFVEATETLEAVTIATADGSNPRIDLVGIQLNDPSAGGAGGRNSEFDKVTGTAAASPTVPATPDSFLVLAQVLVPAAATSIVDADITDLRTQARLAHEVVNGDAIADDAVDSQHYAFQSVDTAALALEAVTTSRLDDKAVTDAKVGAPSTGSLDSGKIRYARMGNIVHVWTTNTTLGATLPAGFRPAAGVVAPATDDGTPGAAIVSINTAGVIQPGGTDPIYFSTSFSTV